MHRLETPHLDLLAALQQHGTLSAASSAINLSTSAASRRLQEGERRLGFRLVERRGRRLELTAAGRLLADAAVRASRDIDAAEFSARWLQAGEEPPVQVGIGFYDHLDWMLPFDTPFELIRSPSALASDTGNVDLCIDAFGSSGTSASGATPPDESIVDLGEDRLVLVSSHDHPVATNGPVAPSNVRDYRYLASSVDPRDGFEFEEFFSRSGHGPSSVLRIESFAAVVQMAASGTGVSIQPYNAVSNLESRIRISELDKHIPLQWQASIRTSSDAVNAFVDSLGPSS